MVQLKYPGNDQGVMSSDSLLFIVFLIFTGAAVVATLALYARQALIVSYIVLGVVMGPSLLGWVTDASLIESVIVGGGLMFSSTIVGLKLLPTTILHHRHTGEVMISILLLQDVIAIVMMLFLQAGGGERVLLANIGGLALALVGIGVLAWLVERYVLVPLIARFDV